MSQATAGAMTGDAIRGYVIKMREHSKISQDKLADSIGMPQRTYIAWETGETKDIKAPFLLKALQVLGAPFAHLERLVDKRYEDGARLAESWISRADAVAALTPADASPADASRLSRLIDLLADGVAPDEAARIVQRER